MSSHKEIDRWPLQIRLNNETFISNGWATQRWCIGDLLPSVDHLTGFTQLTLELHKDERSAYRFNLNSASPHLFVLCDEDETNAALTPVHITASQDEAASFMDGEHHLLETPMPAAVQCWIDSYLGIYGELIEAGKKKKKRGKGRSSER